MNIPQQVAVIVAALALVSGCADPQSRSTGDSGAVESNFDSSETSRAWKSLELKQPIVKVTEAAALKFKEFLAAEPSMHIRLSVKTEELPTFFYSLRIDDSLDAADLVDRSHGFTLVVDPKSAPYLTGATIDWQTNSDGQAGFKFDNPNAKCE